MKLTFQRIILNKMQANTLLYCFNTFTIHYLIPHRNPNEGTDVVIPWPAYDEQSNEYLEISDEPMVLQETEDMLDTYQFWRKDFPSIVEISGFIRFLYNSDC